MKVSYKSLNSHALIISGVRRCGKSTLLLQIIAELDPSEEILFLNFENPQLFDFKVQDFYKLDAIIERRKAKILFFDELQIFDRHNKSAPPYLLSRFQNASLFGTNTSSSKIQIF